MKKTVVGVYVERFSVDFPGKKISGTKASFGKASKGSGPIYEELARKVANHPDFTLVVEEPKTKSVKPREVYKGMTVEFMRDYLAMKNDAYADKLEKVIQFAKNNNKKPYPLAKKYFLKHFTNGNGNIVFDFAKAKADVEAYLIAKTEIGPATGAKAEAAENTPAPTASAKPDPSKNNIIPAQTLAPAGNF